MTTTEVSAAPEERVMEPLWFKRSDYERLEALAASDGQTVPQWLTFWVGWLFGILLRGAGAEGSVQPAEEER